MVKMQATSHWHTGQRKPPIVIIVASDTPRLNELISRVDDLLHSLSKLLELLLVLIAIALECAEIAVALCNHLYGAYSGYNKAFEWWLAQWQMTPLRGLG
jgi:hypothetical protein